MAAPTWEEAQQWAQQDGSAFSEAQVTAALATEKANQAIVCTVPADDADWPADLAEALLRRVHRNLVTAKLPLGLDPSANSVEIRRLEAGHPRLVFG